MRALGLAIGAGAIVALSVLALRGSLASPERARSADSLDAVAGTEPARISSVQGTAASSTTSLSSEGDGQETTPAPAIGNVVQSADGKVTFEEYTEAVYNTMTCLDEKGIEHTDPVYDEASAQYTYMVTNPPGTDPRDVSAYDECWMKYERDVQARWVKQNAALIRPEVVNEEGALACAAAHGIEATTFEDILVQKREHPDDRTVQHCLVIGTNGFDPSVAEGEHRDHGHTLR